MVSENNLPEEEEVVEVEEESSEEEEVVEESSTSSDGEIKCIATFKQNPNRLVECLVFTMTGYNEDREFIGPVTVVAPSVDTALELSNLTDINIISVGPEE